MALLTRLSTDSAPANRAISRVGAGAELLDR
jgi:hypothetical protein